MDVFTPAERQYLESQPLARFASASPTGVPDVSPVTFGLDGDAIVSGGFNIAKTVRYRNFQTNTTGTIVVDDLATVDPWTPRGIKVRGAVTIEDHDGGQRFKITPEVIWSWGINDPKPGVPSMDRRTVGEA